MPDPRPDRQSLDGQLTTLAALAEPVRRALYRFVAGQDHAVGRDEAADGLGISRSAAAFHLDRLVADGLLDAEFRRLGDRRGPGAGRPAKLYRRAEADIAVSLPARRYDLAAELLATAVTRAAETGVPVDAAVRDAAQAYGTRLATAAAAGGEGGFSEPVPAAVAVLAGEGYEPRVGADEVVLVNCPFHDLVADHPALVCGMNLALLEGFAAGVPGAGLTARLAPSAHACCVRLGRSPAPPA